MGIRVNKLPPIVKPSRDVTKIIIPGRSGFLTEDNRTYKEVIRNVECTVTDLSKIELVNAWLDGSGDVTFSNQDDRFYKASILNQIPFSKLSRKHSSFIITFDCQPFGYDTENYKITLLAPTIINNMHNYYSEPVIKVYGSGEVTLSIGSEAITLKNIVDYVTIDTPLMDCYKDTLLKNTDMDGDFPIIPVGESLFSWTGSITKVEIIPNWQYL